MERAEPPEVLDIAVEQIAPVCGDRAANEALIAARLAQAAGARLVVFPELALTGYAVGDRAWELAVRLHDGAPPVAVPENVTCALGLVERGDDHLLYNTAVVFRSDGLLARHRKIYLPTYGMFQEGRVFARGRRVRAFDLDGWRTGLLVCEDFWHPALTYLLTLQGIELLLVLAAAPGRGRPSENGARPPEAAPSQGDAAGAHPRLFASTERWEWIARATAVLYGIYVVLANRVGVEGATTFAGASLVVAPDGEVVRRAPEGEPARVEASLARAAVARARRPFSHLRDEDPALVWRELGRLLEAP